MLDIDIEKMIPHRDRLKLIDGVLELNDDKAVCLAIVKESWPLFENGEACQIIMIELVAQTIGIAAGHKKYKETGKGARGYLVGIKHADFNAGKLSSGECLIIKVETFIRSR